MVGSAGLEPATSWAVARAVLILLWFARAHAFSAENNVLRNSRIRFRPVGQNICIDLAP
jgi:hypothetical protein